MLQEFKDVFLDELPRLPQECDTVFSSILVLGIILVSKASFIMNIVELMLLKNQFQELLER